MSLEFATQHPYFCPLAESILLVLLLEDKLLCATKQKRIKYSLLIISQCDVFSVTRRMRNATRNHSALKVQIVFYQPTLLSSPNRFSADLRRQDANKSP